MHVHETEHRARQICVHYFSSCFVTIACFCNMNLKKRGFKLDEIKVYPIVVFFFFFFSLFFSIILFPCPFTLVWNSCCPPWVRHGSWKSSATHSYQCAVFSCVQTMVWLPVFGILQLMHAIGGHMGVYGQCKRVCTGSWLWEEKTLDTPGTWNRVSIVPGFSDALPAKLLPPQNNVQTSVSNRNK